MGSRNHVLNIMIMNVVIIIIITSIKYFETALEFQNYENHYYLIMILRNNWPK